MRFLLPLALLLSTTAVAGNTETVHIRDLDASTMPHRVDFDATTLELKVDNTPVKGSMKKKLDYLEIVLATERGIEPAELGFDAHRKELRRRRVGVGLLYAGSGVAIAASVAAAPFAVVIGAPFLVQTGGLGVIIGTRKRFDAEGLERDVDLYGMTDLYSRR